MYSEYGPPTRDAVRAAVADQSRRVLGLMDEMGLTPEQRLALDGLLDAVERRYRLAWARLTDQLAELHPGAGPAIRWVSERLADDLD